MLAIKRKSTAYKAFTAGSLAFAIGLTSVAAYVSSTLEHQNLVFSKEQTVTKSQNEAETKVVVAAEQEGEAVVAQPEANNGQLVATPAAPQVSAPQSVGVAATQTASTEVVGVTPTPITEPTPQPEPVPTTPGGVDLGLELCADLIPGILPIIGVNCRTE